MQKGSECGEMTKEKMQRIGEAGTRGLVSDLVTSTPLFPAPRGPTSGELPITEVLTRTERVKTRGSRKQWAQSVGSTTGK